MFEKINGNRGLSRIQNTINYLSGILFQEPSILREAIGPIVPRLNLELRDSENRIFRL